MLNIHTGLRKLGKKNVFEIGKPCIIIPRRELLFEQYRMALKRDNYDIEVQNDDALKRN